MEVRYFAAAKAATGMAAEAREAPEGTTVGALVDRILADATPASGSAERVFARCSFIVNDVATTDRALMLEDGDRIDVLPPFAGG